MMVPALAEQHAAHMARLARMGAAPAPKLVIIRPGPVREPRDQEPLLGAKVRTGLPWPQEEVDLLRSMAASRTCLSTICKRLRRSEGAVRKRARTLGIEVSRFVFRGPIILPHRADDITALYKLVVNIDRSRSVKVREIIKLCAQKHGLTVEDILSEQRTNKIAHARQQAMWLAAKETSASFAEIGRIFNRDHSTVIHAVQRENARTGESVRADPREVRKMARAGL